MKRFEDDETSGGGKRSRTTRAARLALGLTALFGMCPLYALLHLGSSREPGMPRGH